MTEPENYEQLALEKCWEIETYPASQAQTLAITVASAALELAKRGGYIGQHIEALHRAADFIVQDAVALRQVAECRGKDWEAASAANQTARRLLREVVQRLESHGEGCCRLDARDRNAVKRASEALRTVGEVAMQPPPGAPLALIFLDHDSAADIHAYELATKLNEVIDRINTVSEIRHAR